MQQNKKTNQSSPPSKEAVTQTKISSVQSLMNNECQASPNFSKTSAGSGNAQYVNGLTVLHRQPKFNSSVLSRLPGVSSLISETKASVTPGNNIKMSTSRSAGVLPSYLSNGFTQPSSTDIPVSSAEPKISLSPSLGVHRVSRTQSNMKREDSIQNGKRPRCEPTFMGLVQIMLHHPLLPLIFKGTFEAATGLAPNLEDRRSIDAINRAMKETAKIEEISKNIGLRTMMHDKEGVDLFLVVLLNALNTLRDSNQVPISAPLDSMITACSRKPENLVTFKVGSPVRSASPPLTPSFVINTRTKLGDDARRILSKWFDDHYDNPYPTEAEKLQLAKECDLQLNQINNFFGNLRMRMKRKILLQRKTQHFTQSGLNPPASAEQSTLAPKTKWRDIVLSQKRVLSQFQELNSTESYNSSHYPATEPIHEVKRRRLIA